MTIRAPPRRRSGWRCEYRILRGQHGLKRLRRKFAVEADDSGKDAAALSRNADDRRKFVTHAEEGLMAVERLADAEPGGAPSGDVAFACADGMRRQNERKPFDQIAAAVLQSRHRQIAQDAVERQNKRCDVGRIEGVKHGRDQ